MSLNLEALSGGRAPNEAEILGQVPAARERAVTERQHGIRAADARYSPAKGQVVLTMTTGAELRVPVSIVAALRDRSRRELSEVAVTATGAALRWERLDVDLSVPAVVQAALGGAAAAMGVLGAAGGAVSSPHKAEAARVNGAKGGRPKGSGTKTFTPVRPFVIRHEPSGTSLKVAARLEPLIKQHGSGNRVAKPAAVKGKAGRSK